MSKNFQVKVSPIPEWLDWRRLLGAGTWVATQQVAGGLELEAALDRREAADLAARLRGVGIGGELLTIDIVPPLNRKELRRASTDEARRRRERSVGFSRSSARLDDEGRISLTPESLALALGERARGLRVIDACAGAGGNAIGFARAGCSVLAIEIDRARLAMAKHNAGVYGVADRIRFVCADACEILPDPEADLLFVDPPWGGNYDKERVGIDDLEPAKQLIARAGHVPTKWLKVPPSFDPATLPGCRARAIFGSGRGDERRVKFLLIEVGASLPDPD
ncbi:MAG: methyltransferase domain-containing protein [Verrucomicrobiales bacterium]